MALSVFYAGAVWGFLILAYAIFEEAYDTGHPFGLVIPVIFLNSAAMEFVSFQRLLQMPFCSSGMVPVRGFPFLSFGKVCF